MATDELSRRFAALADPTRRAILARLAEGEATVNELAAPFPVTIQSISKHIKVLEKAGLITRGRAGQLRPSRLEGAGLKEVDDWVAGYRRFWDTGLDRLDERLRAGERNSITPAQVVELRAAPIGLTLTRVFDAPRKRVWREWTEPSRFADWFGGAESEVPRSSVSLHLVQGGAWTATTLSFGPERQDIRWEGEYVEIVEPERLAFTIHAFPGAPSPDLVTVSFTDLSGERTEICLQQQGERTPEQHERSRAYWSDEFDQIARRLTANPVEDV